MNAPLTLPHGLTNAALNGEDLLRLLAARPHGQPFSNQSEIAKATGRAPKNIGRDLGQLETAGLIKAPGVDYGEWSSSALTDAGWDALTALDRAGGQGGEGLIHVAPALLDDNPLNPRKTYDPDKLETLADTIEAAGRVIVPLEVSPPYMDGRRFVWAGHRRKRGALIVDARFAARGEPLPPGLAQGVPCVERAATEAESLFVAVVENQARENLAPWEEAKALAALAEATGWSGRELARRTGRAPRLDQGDETGVRDTQEKIKVARTAPADLVQAHEAGAITWEQLRGALRTGRLTEAETAPDGGEEGDDDKRPRNVGLSIPSAPMSGQQTAPTEPEAEPALTLDPQQRLTLLEILHAARLSPDRLLVGDDDDAVAYAPTGKYWLDLVASTLQTLRLIDFKHHGRPYVRVTPAGWRWLEGEYGAEIHSADADTARHALIKALAQAHAVFSDTAWEGPGYTTDWLNPPPPEPDAADMAAAIVTEPDTVDVEDAVAAQLLQDAVAMALQAEPGSTTVRNILARSGVAGPFVVSARLAPDTAGIVFDAAGEAVCVADVDNQLPDDTARARSIVIAAALNRFCGYQTTKAQ